MMLVGPSAVHPLPRLSEALGGQVEIWAKREDCNSGIAFGGQTALRAYAGFPGLGSPERELSH